MENKDLKKAIELLGEHRAAFVSGEKTLVSDARGVRFLMSLIKNGTSVSDYVAADRVVGKASAFLYAYLDVKTLHAFLTTHEAIAYLEKSGVTFTYDKAVDVILSNDGVNPCPMEQAVRSAQTAEQAIAAIKNKIAEMAT